MAKQEILYEADLGYLRLTIKPENKLPQIISECYLDPMSLNTEELVVMEIVIYTGHGVMDNSFANRYGRLAMLKLRKALIEWATGQGFQRITGSYTRIESGSTSNPGKRKLNISL